MRRVRTGLVGAGVSGPLHVDALRRLGYVEVLGLATSSPGSAKEKAARLRIERAYSSWQELVADPDLEAVHICTPNHLHYPVAMAALAHGKHVLCGHPLAPTAVEARRMRDSARAARLINAVTLEYRFNPVAQQARAIVRRGDLGEVRFVQGHHLQDSLSYDTDFSWRLEPEHGGPSNSMAAIGARWIDAVRFITGLGVERVLACLHTTIPLRRGEGRARSYVVTSEDVASVMLHLEGGVHCVFTAGQVLAGHENDLRIEINGSQSSLCWDRESRDRLWVGRRDRPRELLSEGRGPYDTLESLIQSVYSFIAAGGDPVEDHKLIDFPTFDDGYRASCVVDAAIRSNVGRNRWIKVEY